jgi:hypothetical protein
LDGFFFFSGPHAYCEMLGSSRNVQRHKYPGDRFFVLFPLVCHYHSLVLSFLLLSTNEVLKILNQSHLSTIHYFYNSSCLLLSRAGLPAIALLHHLSTTTLNVPAQLVSTEALTPTTQPRSLCLQQDLQGCQELTRTMLLSAAQQLSLPHHISRHPSSNDHNQLSSLVIMTD